MITIDKSRLSVLIHTVYPIGGILLGIFAIVIGRAQFKSHNGAENTLGLLGNECRVFFLITTVFPLISHPSTNHSNLIDRKISHSLFIHRIITLTISTMKTISLNIFNRPEIGRAHV